MLIPFGRWAPGLAKTTTGRSTTLDGLVPRADDSYGPMSQLSTLGGATALATAPAGTIAFAKADGSWVRYVGITAKIQQVDVDGTLTDIDTSLALPSGDYWSMVTFGTKLLYTNTADGVIAYDFEAGGSAASVSAAPDSKYLFVVADRVVALSCGGDELLMQTSAINDHTEWVDGGATYQPFADGGPLTGGVAIAQGAAIIFQQSAIRLMSFGSASGMQYTLQLMSRESSALDQRSIVSANGSVYYIAANGPQRISPGMAQPEPIGAVDGIDRWLLEMVDAADPGKIEGAYDQFRRMVWWRIPIAGNSSSVFSKVIGYHIDYKRWTTLTVDTSAIFSTASASYTYATVPDQTYDAILDETYDSQVWSGGEPFFAGFDSAYKFATFTGSPMAVEAESARYVFPRSVYINEVTPDTDAVNATVAIGVSDTLQGDITWTDDVSLNVDGDAMFTERGRAVKGRLKIAAGENWTYLRGFRDINGSEK